MDHLQTPVRVLVVEDSAADAELIQRQLAKGGVVAEYHRVDSEEEMRAALSGGHWDMVILDYNLPTINALEALEILKHSGKDIPALVVSGSVGEQVAVETMRAGAADYVLKDNLTRLVPAFQRELRDARIRHRQAAMAEDLHLLGHAIDAASFGIVIGDAHKPGNPLTRVNHAFTRITGYAAEQIIGRSCSILQGPETDQGTVQAIRDALAAGRQFSGVIRNYRKDGQPFWNHLTIAPVRDAAGELTHFIGLQVDITAQKELEDQLAWVVTHDTLTGLPNRVALRKDLDTRIRGLQAGQRGERAALITLDLDRFGQLNETLGRDVCDRILDTVAERIQSAVPAGSLLARTGADDFAVACSVTGGRAELEAIADRLHKAIAEPFRVLQLNEPLALTVSSGLAIADKTSDAERVIGQAAAALQRSRQTGRNHHHFYSPDMTAGATRTLSLEGALRQAIKQGELTLHYQPQVSIPDRAVVAVEALVRWQHPRHGLISPADFIPLAEDTGLIVPMGEWVLRSAMAQAAAWKANRTGPLRVAVNLSVQQLRGGYIEGLVRDVLESTQLESCALELEITESQLMHDVPSKQRILEHLDEMGVHVAIDDFGTGYSSLAYLTRLKVHTLKIDRSFVKDADSNAGARGIVTAVSTLAHNLGLKVVAEGVETEAQRQLLQRVGCDSAQGYLFCRPLPAAELTEVLRDWRSRDA